MLAVNLIFWLFISFGLGFFFLSLCAGSLVQDNFLKFSGVVVAGLGISSLGIFVWIVLAKGNLDYYLYFEILVAVLLIFWGRKKLFYCDHSLSIQGEKQSGHSIEQAVNKKDETVCHRFAAIVFVMVLLMLSFLCIRNPYGFWDAWSIWNLKARYLFRAAEGWTGIFAKELNFSHPDYPLFLPLTIVRGWLYSGKENLWVPIVAGILPSFALLCSLYGGIRTQRGTISALLAILTMIATPFYFVMTVSQYADVLLSLAFLCSIIFITQSFKEPDPGLLTLSGMIVSLSAWIKNEGLLFCVVIFFCFCLENYLRTRSFLELKNSIKFFLKGALPALIILFFFKAWYAPKNDLFEAGFNYGNILDVERIKMVFFLMANALAVFGKWRNIAWGFFNPMALMGAYLLIKGMLANCREGLFFFLVITLMSVSYFFVYVFTPHDVQWHIETSAGRLLFHLWPCFIYGFFISAASPDAGKK